MADLTNTGNMLGDDKPREDILVSICFSDLPASQTAFAAIRDCAERLDTRFRFREIIIIINHDSHNEYLPLLEQISDIRLLSVRPGTNHYDRRVVAASEAIGDVILFGILEEFAYLDFLALVDQAAETSTIVVATRSDRHSVRKGLSIPISALGRVAGFRVNPNDLQTMALPRSLLSQILLHSNPELALRFPPRDPRLLISFYYAPPNVPSKGGIYQVGRRIQILWKIMIHIAPRILILVSVSSTLLAVLGFGYAIYVLGTWIIVDSIAPGWLTTSMMLSLSATFIGLSMLGLSLGMQQILNQKNKTSFENVTHEINRVDLFGKMASELNVDIEGSDRARNKA